MGRYRKAARIVRDGVLFYGTRPTLDTSHRAGDLFYTVQPGDTLQSIAWRKLGDAKLWWVVAEFNGICNPFGDLEPGTELRLPSRARIWMEILD